MKGLNNNDRMGGRCDPRNPSNCVILLSAYLHVVILLSHFPKTAADEDVVDDD